MKISVLTPSFNKRGYALEAITSVLEQTHTDFEYFIIENSTHFDTKNLLISYFKDHPDNRIIFENVEFSEEQRLTDYPTAIILNTYLPKMTGDIILYLSDDDYFLPTCFSQVITKFEQSPEANVVYFGLSIRDIRKANGCDLFEEVSKITANEKLVKGTNMDCMLDGGQVVFKRHCLDKLTQPYFNTHLNNETAHCDGIFLNKLSQYFDFYNIPDILAVKRRTNISTFIHY